MQNENFQTIRKFDPKNTKGYTLCIIFAEKHFLSRSAPTDSQFYVKFHQEFESEVKIYVAPQFGLYGVLKD